MAIGSLAFALAATAHGAGKHAARSDDLAASRSAYSTRWELIELPIKHLVDSHGRETSLAKLADGSKPVMLNFIFTSCSTICPVMASTFSEVHRAFEAAEDEVPSLISISIDPERDTPERLASYAKQFGASDSWYFLTGSRGAIRQVEEAFGVYRGDKMNHVPLTFVRAAGQERWLRIEGFAPAADLVREYRAAIVD